MTEAVREADEGQRQYQSREDPIDVQVLLPATLSLSLFCQWTFYFWTCFVVRYNIKIAEKYCIITPNPPLSFMLDNICILCILELYISLNPLYIRFFSSPSYPGYNKAQTFCDGGLQHLLGFMTLQNQYLELHRVSTTNGFRNSYDDEDIRRVFSTS